MIEAVSEELEGPGQLLGYRTMNQKIRLEHGVKVPRNLVRHVMLQLDPDGVDSRAVQNREKRKKQPFLHHLMVQTGYCR